MERTTGIGGFFFRAEDPARLSRWYEEHLGVRPVGEAYEDGSWWQEAGPTVFSRPPAAAPTTWALARAGC